MNQKGYRLILLTAYCLNFCAPGYSQKYISASDTIMVRLEKEYSLIIVDGVPATKEEVAQLLPETIRRVDTIVPSDIAALSCYMPRHMIILVTTKKASREWKIIDGIDGTPLSGATAAYTIPGSSRQQTTTSDANGIITLPRSTIAGRRIRLAVSHVGYDPLASVLTGDQDHIIILDRVYKPVAPVVVAAYGTRRTQHAIHCWLGVPIMTGTTEQNEKRIQPENAATIYPNPVAAGSSLYIRFGTAIGGTAEISVFSSNGALVRRGQWQIQEGSNTLSVPGSAPLVAGAYLLRVQWPGINPSVSYPFIVQ